MEPAEKEDLKLASRQGTILEIRVNLLQRYGKGGFRSPTLYASQYATYTIIGLLGLGLLVGLMFKCREGYKKRQKVLDYFDDVDPCATSCALAGLECKVGLSQQKPTASDPMGVDFFRFPRLVRKSADEKQYRDSNAKMPSSKKSWQDDGLTEMGSDSEEEGGTEKKSPSRFSRSAAVEDGGKTEKKAPASPARFSWFFSKKEDSKKESTKKKEEGGVELGYMAFPPETNLTNKGEAEVQQAGYVHPEIVSKAKEQAGAEKTGDMQPASETNSTRKDEPDQKAESSPTTDTTQK